MDEYSGKRTSDQISVMSPLMQMPVAYHDFFKADGTLEERDYLMVTVQGTPETGFIGYVEYWTSPNTRSGYAPEFDLVIYETSIVESAALAFELAVRRAAKAADSEHVTLVDFDLLLQAVKL